MWQSNWNVVLGAWLFVALLGVIVLFAEWRAARRLRRTQDETERRLALLHKQTESAVTMAVRAGRRLKRLEKQLAWVSERIGQLEVRNEGRSYDQAITLARRGADPARLMTNFGLSRGEADLVALMHNQRKAG
ncbi:MAG TPA: DUF2802 domain-containing protein [Steroidobacteraceae bacterium]|nr:DUF2802 domain-containing protein [Steroidobacteraceae bacterium]